MVPFHATWVRPGTAANRLLAFIHILRLAFPQNSRTIEREKAQRPTFNVNISQLALIGTFYRIGCAKCKYVDSVQRE
ncbi:hypothetical protein M3J09_001361 [Ascochyta lentis]